MDPTISGSSVRAAREGAKLSQSTVAKALGMNRMYYSLFEAGRYVLDETERAALHEFLESQGVKLASEAGSTDKASETAENFTPPEVPADQPVQPAERGARTRAADVALALVRATVQATGVDSKRTAAAVATANSALQALDFAELLTLAESANTAIEGLPDVAAFAGLSLDKKQLWESRAAGMLVCSALYGDAWQSSPCGELSRAGNSVRQLVATRDWDVKDLSDYGWGFFKDQERHRPHYRCELAPHIAKAAETRRAPALP